MFETLDAATLSTLTNMENQPAMQKDTKLSDLLDCLEQATQECRDHASASEGGGSAYQQVAAGLMASQAIVTKWWERIGT